VSDLRGLLGLLVLGLAIQVAFAALVLRWSVGRDE
jgi:hypothetical protein